MIKEKETRRITTERTISLIRSVPPEKMRERYSKRVNKSLLDGISIHLSLSQLLNLKLHNKLQQNLFNNRMFKYLLNNRSLSLLLFLRKFMKRKRKERKSRNLLLLNHPLSWWKLFSLNPNLLLVLPKPNINSSQQRPIQAPWLCSQTTSWSRALKKISPKYMYTLSISGCIKKNRMKPFAVFPIFLGETNASGSTSSDVTILYFLRC